MARLIKPKKIKDLKKEEKLEQHFQEKIKTVSDGELVRSLEENRKQLSQMIGDSSDVVMRDFSFEVSGTSMKAMLFFIDGLISTKIVDEHIMHTLMISLKRDAPAAFAPSDAASALHEHTMPIGESKITGMYRDAVKAVLAGDTALLVEGCEQALLLSSKGWEKRGVDEPRTESVVRGPREAFTETLRVNTALIRRHLKDTDLRIKNITVGERSNTDVSVVYLEGVAKDSIVDEIIRRIQDIEIDGIWSTGYIEQFIEDNHWSPFPLMQNSERTDKAVANLLEGRVVVLVDGSPFALIAPAVFTQFYQSPEDYYERFLIATLLRFIRAISMTMALLLPSIYISFSSFHPEMIPSKLVIAMAAGRATVPFPSVVEAFAMEISIEILREASVRLPGPIGPTIGIVGALIVGEASVRAGIVSPIMVIVVALTTIGSFAAPSYNAAIALRMLRFPVMLLAAVFGLYGIMLFVILIVIHMSSLKSFGVPYLRPLTPSSLLALGDTFIRIPLYKMVKRPEVFVKRSELKRMNSASAEDIKPDEKGTDNRSDQTKK